MMGATSSNRGGRLKEILQFKNDQCIYDFPEQWNSEMDSSTTMNTIREVDEEEAMEVEVKNEPESKSKARKKPTKVPNKIEKRKSGPQNKLAKNIVHKYNMLNYRRNHKRRMESEESITSRTRSRDKSASNEADRTIKKRPAAAIARKRISKIPASSRLKLRSSEQK